MTNNFQAAAALAAQGWRIFPLLPNSKLPALKAWQDKATNDAGMIAAWWTDSPDAGIGLLTGHSGVWVLDVDTNDGKVGAQSLAALDAVHGPLPATLTARTASGGKHLYFTAPEVIRNSASRCGKDLDIRGLGGYVVAPPTVINGSAYTWESLAPIAAAPDWLVKLATAAAPTSTTGNSTVAHVEPTAELVADLRSALTVLDANDRDVWIACAGALRCLGEDGHALWLEWSRTSPKYHDGDEATFDTVGADNTGYAAIFAKAAAVGWVNPARLRSLAEIFGKQGVVLPSGERLEPAADPCSEIANAQRIVAAWGARLLFVEGAGWHTWPAGRWQADDLGARRLVHGLGAMIRAEATALKPTLLVAEGYVEAEKAQRNRARWATTSSQKKTRDNSLSLASELINCKAGDMDADADLVGAPNGVVDLRTGAVRAGLPTDRITKALAAEFNTAAVAPYWERFIIDITGGNAELAGYLQRLAGYALSGRPNEHILPICFGAGGNGKSTFLNTVQAVMGDYSGTAAPGLLVTSAERQHASATSDLPGKRLVIASESGEFGRLNEDVVKSLTGGDRIFARRLYQAGFEFKPTHCLVLQTNYKPRVSGTDAGIWRRIQLVPFTVAITDAQRDLNLDEKLLAEWSGVLAWIYRGLVAYRAEGLRPPAVVVDASKEYRASSDWIGAWLADCCTEVATATVAGAELYANYRTWCLANGEKERSQRDLSLRLSERGFFKDRTREGTRWTGLKLTPTGLHVIPSMLMPRAAP